MMAQMIPTQSNGVHEIDNHQAMKSGVRDVLIVDDVSNILFVDHENDGGYE